MHLHAFIALVAFAGSVALALRQPTRTLGIIAAVISAAEWAMAQGVVTLHFAHAGLLQSAGWVAVLVLGALMLRKQTTPVGGAICGAVLTTAAIPVLNWLGLIH
jgi:hypothetical protein